MALSEEARKARNEYYRRRYHDPKGREAHEAAQERYWLKKAQEYKLEQKGKECQPT